MPRQFMFTMLTNFFLVDLRSVATRNMHWVRLGILWHWCHFRRLGDQWLNQSGRNLAGIMAEFCFLKSPDHWLLVKITAFSAQYIHKFTMVSLWFNFGTAFGSDFTVYYIHFEIAGGTCNLIGSNWCNLFTNHTFFCSKSHHFIIAWVFDTWRQILSVLHTK